MGIEEGSDSGKISIDPELAKDLNYVAYKAQETELKEKHMGKWVAFLEGKLVLLENDKETLIKRANEEGYTGFLFKEIVAEEQIYHIRGPRIVRN